MIKLKDIIGEDIVSVVVKVVAKEIIKKMN